MRTPSTSRIDAVLEAGQRRAVGIAQIRAVERERRLAHALEKHRLAEVELVIAGHENIRRDHVGERDDVRAAVEPGHHRGRERVAAMRHDHAAALRARLLALGLDDRGEARKAAARLAVRERLLAHQVEVVEQHEGDVRAVRRLRPGRAPARQQRERGGEGGEEGAAIEHVRAFSLAAPLTCV